jgi:O-antigen ligase
MQARAARAVHGKREDRGEARGRAYALGRICFLALVVLTPLVIGALPPQAGPVALFRAFDPVSLPKVVVLLVLAGLSLGSLCVSAARGESELRWHPVLWVLVALVGWAGVSTFFAASPAVSIWGAYLRNEGLVAILGYGLVAFLAVQYVRSTGDLRTVMAAAVVSGALVSVYALLQYAGVDPIEWSQTWRVVSSFGNADMLGDYLVFPFALALGLALSARDRWRSLGWWAAGALITLALAAAETRGAWIAVFVLVICMVWAGWRRLQDASRRQKLALGGLAVALTAAVAAGIVLVVRGSAGGSASLSSVLANASNGRTVIWLIGLRAWLVHPITGWGPDAFMRAFESAVGADWYATLSGGGVGFGSADNAHNFLVQALVTLGIPGLALTAWALIRTAMVSRGGIRSANGRSRLLLVALWGALVGMTVALMFGVTTPEVSAWLWLTVGLILAPASHRVPLVPRAALVTGVALGLALASWAGSWLVADVIVGRAMQDEAGPAQVSALASAATLNPLSPRYRWFVGEALVNEAVAGQRAGQSRQTVDGTMLRAISAYYAAAAADRGDVLVRVALADVLTSYARNNPGSDAAQRAVGVALEAVGIGPRDVAALVTLAKAYQVAGSHVDAVSTARLAREVAPAYAAQMLGSLGAETTSTP